MRLFWGTATVGPCECGGEDEDKGDREEEVMITVMLEIWLARAIVLSW